MRKHRRIVAGIVCSLATVLVLLAIANPAYAQQCQRTVTASVVALDQPFLWNRLGTAQPQGMIFALERDVVPLDSTKNTCGKALCAGNVTLQPDKRPRPLVLRANVGDCLQINFTNLLNTSDQIPFDALAGVHVMGLELVGSIASDASWVGQNPNSYASPGDTKTYTYYAGAEGTFLLSSVDDPTALQNGLFGAVNVQPEGAEWYRSQVTRADLHLATYDANNLPANMTLKPTLDAQGQQITTTVDGKVWPVWTLTTLDPNRQTVHTAQVVKLEEPTDGHLYTLSGQPLVNYQAVYPSGSGPRQGQPILALLQKQSSGPLEIVYSDLTAIITGPSADRFPYTNESPSFRQNPASPDRRQPYREFTIHYHNANNVVQAFAQLNTNTMSAGGDFFAINYGMAGIGAEVFANRLGVGPMGHKDAVDLKFEEFFLSSWAVGDPAMVVDVPANAPKPQATKAFYPDDPSNVYHSYLRDHVKFRILNTGMGPTHVHHLHAHQWLRSPNSDSGHYLDSQMITAGSTYTLEITYGGGGNRNLTVGDSIFHCHFYPHFAAGMWSLWRVHDVFERGTLLDTAGRPQPGARALPDGEIVLGTPIPALVPLPTLAMAPMPAQVKLVDNGRRAEVQPEQVVNGKSVYKNPGYPFFVPGVAGHRAPHPPLDFAWEEEAPGQPKRYTAAQAQAEQAQVGKPVLLNGGLPRHLVLDGETVREFHTRWDFTKDFVLYDKEDKKDPSRIAIAGGLVAFELPEEGTAVEQAAMAAHAQRAHASFQPNGDRGNFLHNGLPPTHGAPFADPSVDDDGNAVINTRRYQAAVMQMDVVLNKQGWHYPQQRFIALWEDVKPTVSGARAPQPFFFRANTGESVEYWHTNLVPDYYELDDFQVRTPTDILGQHIHLVKFDVMASDGAGNGFNYEDGTFSPDEVRGRIDAINRKGGLYGFDDKTQFIDRDPQKQRKLQAKPAPAVFGTPPPGQNWTGAQTTIQRWDTDPLLNNEGEDRTLRTVFTHDHFGPSTHQQIGLYGGLLVEPENSTWYDPVTGGLLYDTTKRRDGGPTGWQANIITADPADSYREFALEFQDFQLAYTSNSSATPTTPTAALFNICPTPNNEPSCQLTDLINQLNRGGTVTPAVSNAFAQNGVTLSPNATIVVQTPGSKWQLSNPYYIPAGGQPDCNSPSVRCDRYPIVNNTSTQLVGLQVSISPVVPGWSNPQFAVNPPSDSSNTANGPPYPTLISTGGAVQGTYSLMYRNEPLPLRVNPSPPNQASSLTPEQQQQAVDLSQVFRSIPRRDATLNIQPNPGAPLDQQQPSGFKFPPDLVPTCHPNDPPELRCLPSKQQPTDPYTPLLRAYENDRVQIRTLVGGQLVSHTFQVHGVKWLYEPTSPNSGYRNVQGMGLSEHFEMLFTLPPASTTPTQPFADYVYAPSSGQAGLTNGLWGILRAYQGVVADLQPLPNNPQGMAPPQLKSDCPSGAPVRSYAVVATTAAQALPGGVLVYNSDQSDPLAIVYVRAEDLDAQGKLKPGVPIEPLVLRAAAGECIEITLQNNFDPQCATPNAQQPQCATFTKALAAPAPFTPPSSTGALPTINLNTSLQVGLHPQLVAYDVSQANGINVGLNPPKTVAPGQPNQIFRWYAGSLTLSNTGDVVARPVEFGALNLVPSDPLMQDPKGLVGALIIEPPGATWTEDPTTRAAATVTAKKEDGTSSSFREFVVVMQSDAMEGNLLTFNYKTNVAASTLHLAEPLTPIFPAVAGTPVRFRVVYPGGDGDFVVAVHGHSWQEEPYVRESTEIGSNPLSQWFGGQQLTPYQSLNLVLPSAGGPFQVQGDYLYQVYLNAFASGQWGIFRVSPIVELATVPQPPVAAPARVTPAPATPPVLRSQKRSQR